MTLEEARQALHDFAGTYDWSIHDTAMFDGQMDKYAHALAELIRANCLHNVMEAEDWVTGGCWCGGADLIDPEVEKIEE